MSPANMSTENYRETFRSVYDSSKDVDSAIHELKRNGATQAVSVLVLVKELSLSLPEADRIVFNSTAWTEAANSTYKWRNEFGDYLEDLSGM
ncbi:MAG: hypothetical protein V4649_12135 [Bacteroidota bacterium]